LSTGAFIPRIRVQFAESTAAHFGQPFAAATLELEYLIWR
jgi:hypothetical protein